MANRDKCCDICGDSGTLEALVTCSGCKDSHEHLYCMHTDTVQLEPPETWLCEDCDPKQDESPKKPTGNPQRPQQGSSQSEIIRRQNYVSRLKNANPTKIKLITQEEAIDLGEGISNIRIVVQRSVSHSASLKNAAAPAKSRAESSLQQAKSSTPSMNFKPDRPPARMIVVARKESPQSSKGLKGNDSEGQRQNSRSILKTPLLKHMQKVQTKAAQRDVNGTKLVLGKSRLGISPAASHSSTLYKGKSPLSVPAAAKNQGSAASRSIVLQQAKRIPSAAASWSGRCKVYSASRQLEAILKFEAHPPARVLKKVYEFSKSMPHLLHFELTPRSDIWKDIDQHLCRDNRDIALYFFPLNKERQNSYDELLKLMEAKDYAMRTRIDGMELLIFTSRVLTSNCQVLRGRHFLWGLFRKVGKPPQEEVDMSEDMDGGKDILGKQDRVHVCRQAPAPPLKTVKMAQY